MPRPRSTSIRRGKAIALTRPIIGLALALCATACSQASADGVSGRVVDEANVLSPQQEDAIGRMSYALEQKTGDQLGVVTVTSLGGRSIEQVSLERAKRWALGSKQLNNGVMIMLAPNDRSVRVEVGTGLEGLLTDEQAAQVIAVMMPQFRNRDYGGGLEQGVSRIDALLRSDQRRPQYKVVKQAA